jgi:multiple sugar transport system substrate-binding protein
VLEKVRLGTQSPADAMKELQSKADALGMG